MVNGSVTFCWKNGRTHTVNFMGNTRGIIDRDDNTIPYRYSVAITHNPGEVNALSSSKLEEFFKSCDRALGVGTLTKWFPAGKSEPEHYECSGCKTLVGVIDREYKHLLSEKLCRELSDNEKITIHNLSKALRLAERIRIENQ